MTLKIMLAQLNATVGDVTGNYQLASRAIQKAKEAHSDIIVFPELFLSGYSPEDLLYRQKFLEDIERALQKLTSECEGIYCLIGHPLKEEEHLYNCASLLYNNEIIATYKKQCLPNHAVFDEKRYFTPGTESCIVTIKTHKIGIVICEDIWHPEPLSQVIKHGAQLILTPNASPYSTTHHEAREAALTRHATVPVVYVNLVGGQDDVVFDGGSMVMNADHEVCAQAAFFKEALLEVEVNAVSSIKKQTLPAPLSTDEKIYQALVLGLKDYVRKNGFKKVLLGVSGGIDSALSLAIAVDALGAENVIALGMPSRYTSELSLHAAEEQTGKMGVSYKLYSIEEVYELFSRELKDELTTSAAEIAKQNCQSRCRSVILMTIANAMNALVLTTSNRSELAMGYGTLYGDMAGAFCVLKDIPKTLVYRLANLRNQREEIIPQAVMDRPPTAELAPNQTDQDSLPPYDILDNILKLYINDGLDVADIVKQGLPLELVKKVVRQLHLNEYKRQQAPPGVRINHNAFGRDRRYPVTSKYRDEG